MRLIGEAFKIMMQVSTKRVGVAGVYYDRWMPKSDESVEGDTAALHGWGE